MKTKQRHIAVSFFFAGQIGFMVVLLVLAYFLKWKVSIIEHTNKNVENSRFNNNNEKDWNLIPILT